MPEGNKVIVQVRKEGNAYNLTMHAPEGITESEFRARAAAIGENATLAPERARWATELDKSVGVKAAWRVSGRTDEAPAQALDKVKSRLAEWMGTLGYEVEFAEDTGDPVD